MKPNNLILILIGSGEIREIRLASRETQQSYLYLSIVVDKISYLSGSTLVVGEGGGEI